MQREKKREFPNPEELTALLQKIDAELAIRRTKMDTSRLLGYQIEGSGYPSIYLHACSQLPGYHGKGNGRILARVYPLRWQL